LLQYRARRWFFSLQAGQWSHSLRDGIARNRPSFPSISFTSRITKVLSNVSEQNALRRLPCSPQRLIRTSVSSMTHLETKDVDDRSRQTQFPGRGLSRGGRPEVSISPPRRTRSEERRVGKGWRDRWRTGPG